MKFIQNIILSIAILAIVGVIFYYEDKRDVSASNINLPINEMQAFSEAFLKIKQNYVDDVSNKQLFDNAIKGMLEGLDPHSTFLNEKDFEDLQIGTKGEFGGLGLEVTMDNELVKVITPIDDTPAYRAGIKAGDIIIKIDENLVNEMSLNKAVDLMRGEIGTAVSLTILRKQETNPIEIKIIREKIQIKSVKYEIIDKNYAYIRISSFQDNTGSSLRNAMKNLKKISNNINGYILDLRNNPGGVLEASVEVSDVFIKDRKKLLFTKGRTQDSIYEFTSDDIDLAEDKPIVVIINEGSASAAEIVAGALQDHKRAIIMGKQSFGKGSVQTVLPVTSNTALKITTARYFTPNGRSIQAMGITPDIIVESLKFNNIEKNEMIKESNLKGHLKNNGSKKIDNASSTVENKLVKDDYQLSEALNLLKGISIFALKK